MSFPKVKSEPNDGRSDQQSRGGPVVHVRGDSETELDLLFSVLNNDTKPGQTFRDKNLPLSFFKPPEPKPGGSHSREGSLDFGQGPQQLQATPGGLNVFHSRSHSSPAKLPVSLSLPNAGQHLKQGSGDLIVDNPTSKYFVNNPANPWQTEQCKSHDVTVVGSQNKQSHSGIVGQTGGGLVQQPLVDSSQANIGPLPPGWEQGMTAEGEVYYINHNDKTTSWYDPRIPRNMQKPGALKVGQGLPSQGMQTHRQTATQHTALPQQHNPLPQSNPLAKKQVQPIVQQQPNHLTQQQFLQQQQQQLMKQMPGAPAAVASQIRTPTSMLSPLSNPTQQQTMRTLYVPDQIRLELQKLQKERERLVREQEENARKETMLLKELLNHQATMLQNAGGPGDSLNNMVPSNLMVPAAMQQMNISGVDPFLGQTVMGTDMHARQNSGDSGLGNCYSLPRTPEDFLGNVDALDRHDINNIQKKQQQHHHGQPPVCDFGMNPRQGSLGTLDIAPLSDPSNEPMPMDSDELVSSLTDDLGLGRDFLEMQMMDILL